MATRDAAAAAEQHLRRAAPVSGTGVFLLLFGICTCAEAEGSPGVAEQRRAASIALHLPADTHTHTELELELLLLSVTPRHTSRSIPPAGARERKHRHTVSVELCVGIYGIIHFEDWQLTYKYKSIPLL